MERAPLNARAFYDLPATAFALLPHLSVPWSPGQGPGVIIPHFHPLCTRIMCHWRMRIRMKALSSDEAERGQIHAHLETAGLALMPSSARLLA